MHESMKLSSYTNQSSSTTRQFLYDLLNGYSNCSAVSMNSVSFHRVTLCEYKNGYYIVFQWVLTITIKYIISKQKCEQYLLNYWKLPFLSKNWFLNQFLLDKSYLFHYFNMQDLKMLNKVPTTFATSFPIRVLVKLWIMFFFLRNQQLLWFRSLLFSQTPWWSVKSHQSFSDMMSIYWHNSKAIAETRK